MLSLIVFYRPLFGPGHFNSADWRYYNYDLLRQSVTCCHSPPLRDESAPVIFGVALQDSLASPISPALSPLQGLFLFGLSTDDYIRIVIVVYAVIGCLSMYFLLVELGVGPWVAMLFAALFSETSAVPSRLAFGHWAQVGVALLPLALLGAHRAAAGKTVWLGALAFALSTLEGFAHVPIWIGFFGSLYVFLWFTLERRLSIPLAWVKIALGGFLLGAVKFVPMLAAHAAYVAPQNLPSFDVRILVRALAARGQTFAWPANYLDYTVGGVLVRNIGFWEYSCYIGIGGLVLLGGSLFGGRRSLSWIGLGAVTLALLLPTPLFPWVRQHVPLMHSERAPSRYLCIAVFSFAVAAAHGMTNLARFVRPHWIVPALATAFLSYLTWDLSTEAAPWLARAISAPLPWVSPPQPLPGTTGWASVPGAALSVSGVAAMALGAWVRLRTKYGMSVR